MDNLLKIKFIKVPWSVFVAVGNVIERTYVESSQQKWSTYGIDYKKIVCIQVQGSSGYGEYVVVESSGASFRCGQILHSTYCNENDGYMTIALRLLAD